ncbi:MAG: hypothetical protein IJ619_10005 [Eubacterium sp.]|nr:hypothetical protein [Eubacterium sp.]
MKNIIKKLRKKINNSGSSIVLVVVGLGFIGVLVGALLTVAGYALRSKIYNYNSKDNFFYLEQAMDEIYAGIGQQTMDALKDAYDDTVNEVVYYNTSTKSYEAMPREEANTRFKANFMEKVYNNPFFQDDTTMEDYLNSLISNDTVKVKNAPKIVVYDGDGNQYANLLNVTTVSRVVIQGVVLTRTAGYTRSNAKASFTQTISTDIEISQPDFDVDFGTSNIDMSNVFDYALIAGDGVEISQKLAATKTLTVKGNVYAAADYYNKGYAVGNANGKTFKYTYLNIPKDTDELIDCDVNATVNTGLLAQYKGDKDESRYSGIYINDSNVAFLSDTMVVPGSIAVMNGGSVSIYNKNESSIGKARVWCDDFVLGGKSLANPDGKTYSGSTALLRADLFVEDDLQLDANGSYFSMNGSYIGYSNSTQPDIRAYLAGVDEKLYKDSKGDRKGHFNSSAIAVNGLASTLDFESVDKLYVGGRDYIEHSKRKTVATGTDTIAYLFNSTVDDYKTGESVSIKSNQLAYVPTNFGGKVYMVDWDNNGRYDANDDFFIVSIGKPLSASDLYLDHFPSMSFGQNGLYNLHVRSFDLSKAPKDGAADGVGAEIADDVTLTNCVRVLVKSIQTSTDVANNKTKNFVYYDFDANWNVINNTHGDAHYGAVSNDAWTYCSANGINNADKLRKDFIMAYTDAVLTGTSDTATKTEKDLAEVLNDISNYEGYTDNKGEATYEPEYIRYKYQDIRTGDLYNASGAITASEKSSFRLIEANNSYSADYVVPGIDQNIGVETDASELNKNLLRRYDYLKFSLTELNPKAATDVIKTNAIDTFLNTYGDDARTGISPINTYFNFDKLIDSAIRLDGYVIVSSRNDQLTLTDNVDGKADGVVRGIIFTSGRVVFAPDVHKFEGMIVAGDKIIFKNDSTVTNVTANPEMCKEIIRELQFSSNSSAEYFLDIFKGYENIVPKKPNDVTEPGEIEYLDYSSVVKYSNWMKNVTEEYGE